MRRYTTFGGTASACSGIAAQAAGAPRARPRPRGRGGRAARAGVGLADLERALPPRHRRRRRHDRGRGQPRTGRRHPRPHRHPPARARARHPGRRRRAAAAARAHGPARGGSPPRRDPGPPRRSSTTRAGWRCCGGPRLADAQLFECDDRSWERLRGMGLERRKRQPDVLSWVDSVRVGVPSSAVLGLPREKAQAWLFRPESSGTLSDLTGDDVVLLTGEATDRFTTVVRDAHLTAGCTLAWVETPDQLEAALAHVSPTHVLLDHVTAKVLEDLLEAARIDGVAWHETPRDVLEATSAQVAEARLNGRTRSSRPR